MEWGCVVNLAHLPVFSRKPEISQMWQDWYWSLIWSCIHPFSWTCYQSQRPYTLNGHYIFFFSEYIHLWSFIAHHENLNYCGITQSPSDSTAFLLQSIWTRQGKQRETLWSMCTGRKQLVWTPSGYQPSAFLSVQLQSTSARTSGLIGTGWLHIRLNLQTELPTVGGLRRSDWVECVSSAAPACLPTSVDSPWFITSQLLLRWRRRRIVLASC